MAVPFKLSGEVLPFLTSLFHCNIVDMDISYSHMVKLSYTNGASHPHAFFDVRGIEDATIKIYTVLYHLSCKSWSHTHTYTQTHVSVIHKLCWCSISYIDVGSPTPPSHHQFIPGALPISCLISCHTQLYQDQQFIFPLQSSVSSTKIRPHDNAS